MRLLGEYDDCAPAPVPPAPLGFIVQGRNCSLLLPLLSRCNRLLSFPLSGFVSLAMCARVSFARDLARTRTLANTHRSLEKRTNFVEILRETICYLRELWLGESWKTLAGEHTLDKKSPASSTQNQ
jgi:hypothetical protein